MTSTSRVGTRMVMLHASGSSPRAFDRLSRLFGAEGIETILPAVYPDPPAARASGDVLSTTSFERCVSDVDAALSAGGADRRLLFGHSMGGLVAIEALLTGIPINAAILYEPIILSLLDTERAEEREALAWDAAVLSDFRRAMAAGTTEEGLARFVEAYGETAWLAIPELGRRAMIGRAAAILAEAEATNRATIQSSSLAKLDFPILVLTGTRSPAVLAWVAKRLAENLPRAELRSLEGLGHMGPISRPDAIAAVTLDFLRSQGLVS